MANENLWLFAQRLFGTKNRINLCLLSNVNLFTADPVKALHFAILV